MTASTDLPAGNAATQRNAVRFNSVLGTYRGDGGVVDLEVFKKTLNSEGLPGGLRLVGRERRQRLHNTAAIAVLADYILDVVYEVESMHLRRWLQSVSLRPDYALNFIEFSDKVHFFPRGHAQTEGLNTNPLTAACGEVFAAGTFRKRVLRGDVPILHLCSLCANAGAEHPEAQRRDHQDPVPAPIIDPALVVWRRTQAPRLQTAILEGENPEHLLSTPTAVLDEIAIGWAAHILSRYPLPNTLRALLSHVSISDTIDPVVLAQTLAALSLDESAWQELLGHHFSTRYHGPNASQQSGRAWVQQLQLLATNNDRAQSQ